MVAQTYPVAGAVAQAASDAVAKIAQASQAAYQAAVAIALALK